MYDESILIPQISEGDEEAFACLFHHYTNQLEIHINAIIKKPDLVADIIQDTFIRVWLNREKLTEVEHVRAWIFTIASNLCFNHLRQIFRQEKRLLEIELHRFDNSDPDFEIDNKEVLQVIQHAVHSLSPQRKKIWQMHRDERMKQKEIAEALGISISTVKNTIAKSLEFIRDQVSKSGHDISLILFIYLEFFF